MIQEGLLRPGGGSRQSLGDFARKPGNKFSTTPRGAGQSSLAAARCGSLLAPGRLLFPSVRGQAQGGLAGEPTPAAVRRELLVGLRDCPSGGAGRGGGGGSRRAPSSGRAETVGALWCVGVITHMAAASVTPPGSLDLLQPGFSKTLLGTKLEAKYLCSACRNILRRPFQAQCGHRYCSFCLNSILSSGPQNCAACVHEGLYEEGISILESSSAFPDNAARREVESLPAVCPNDGCTWKGTLKEYESCHEGLCPFLLTECPACKGLVRLSEKEHHAEQECPKRSLSCQHCKAPCNHADLEVHYEVCPKFPLTCDGCGKKKISREKFQDHVRSCNKCRVPCRFHTVGCSEMVENEELQDHEVKKLREHLALLLSSFLESPASQGSQSQAGPEMLQRCHSLEQKTATFENIVCVLNREVERVAVTAEACSRQHRLDQDKIEALSNKVQQLERSIGLKDLAMADLEQKVSELEASTYDGVFIWKISDFARKRQEAVAGRTPAIFSPGAICGLHSRLLQKPYRMVLWLRQGTYSPGTRSICISLRSKLSNMPYSVGSL